MPLTFAASSHITLAGIIASDSHIGVVRRTAARARIEAESPEVAVELAMDLLVSKSLPSRLVSRYSVAQSAYKWGHSRPELMERLRLEHGDSRAGQVPTATRVARVLGIGQWI